LVFEKGGETKNESLSTFEREKLELVVQQQRGDEAGDEVLGVSFDSLTLSCCTRMRERSLILLSRCIDHQ
jgi:hypothetical protein